VIIKTSWAKSLAVAGGFLALALAVQAAIQNTEQTPGQPAAPQATPTPVVEGHFHHVHLNTTDPKASIEFYTSRFASEKARFAGLLDGVWAQKSWLLFTKVNQPPVWELTSAIWHFGWGAEDMKAEYERQLKLGTKFFTPLTDISDIGGQTGATGRFFYAYVESPDKALIELNTANHHNFGHLHLFSADPVAAGEWYAKHFGARRRGAQTPSRQPRFYRDVQIGPSSSLMLDNVNIIIYPVEYTKKAYAEHWKGKTELESTKGHATDHIGISVDNLAEALDKLRQAGVKVTDEPRTIGKIKFAFIEGPDKIRIEVIEGHPVKE
jgi:catechol 2,3-dioxygenase-like lactoylglutathione lyase family enzyme